MKNFLVACLILLGIFSNSFAQSGANDYSFNTADNCTFGDGLSFNGNVLVTILQPDGKILVGGDFTTYNGTSSNYIARLNEDGSLDLSFDTGTGFDNAVFAIAFQSDGKIIVGGGFSNYNGTVAEQIVRLNTDGSIDGTFATGEGFNSTVYTVAIQPDGKILAGGDFVDFDGIAQNRIARLNADGSLDTSFSPGTGFSNDVKSIALQTDGKIVATGEFLSINGTSAQRITRLNADGSVDPTFVIGSGFNNLGRHVVIQPDGKILVAGSFISYNGTTRKYLARLNTDGSLDATFNAPGTGFSSHVYCIALQPDGKLVVGGYFDEINGNPFDHIARLNSNGTIDNTFIFGTEFYDPVNSICIQPDAKIIAGGVFYSFSGTTRNHILRLFDNGGLDTLFNPGIGFNVSVRATSIRADNKILLGGAFTSYNGVVRNGVALLNEDGSLDPSFDPQGGCTVGGIDGSGVIYATLVQPDNKMIIAGNFTDYNGTTINRIARLNEDGTLDPSFDTGTGFNNEVWVMALQPDGKILAGGLFTSYNGTLRNQIVRLNADGTLDTSFDPGSGFNGQVNSIVIQPDGLIVVGGVYTSFNGTSRNRIARLNADGTLDASFAPGTGFNNTVWAVALQDDGKIIVGGEFTSFNGITRNRVARLNTNGSLDASFTPGTAFNGALRTISIQPDGKIIAGGAFTQFGGIYRNAIARLNTNASLDTSFDPGNGFNMTVFTTPIQADGKIIVAGSFTTYNGTCRGRIARLFDTCYDSDSTLNVNACGSYTENGVTYTVSGTYSQVIPNMAGCDSTLTINLIVGTNTDSTMDVQVCDSFTENGITYSTSGTYTQTIPNSLGCDSIITLNVEIMSNSSVINPTACGPYTENGITYSSSGTYQQVITNSYGCDSTITINLTITLVDISVNQNLTSLTTVETGANFQWLDCSDLFSEIPGETTNLFEAASTGSFAVSITKNGCVDTSACFTIDNQDFYDLPGYETLSAEVFALPVTTVDACDAIAVAFAEGGIAPYNYDWFTQPSNEDTDMLDSLCEGIHTLKIVDNIGDSILVNYYVTDTANFFEWFDTTIIDFVDTIYIEAPNCLIDFASPLDSAYISDLFYLMPDTIPPGDLYFIEIAYYQAGNQYIHQDTISLEDDGWYLIDFSVYCPIKSNSTVKTTLLTIDYPTTLGIKTNETNMAPVIYPNPTSGNFVVSNIPQHYQIKITNVLGENLMSQVVQSNQLDFDLTSYADGLYMISVFTETGNLSSSFILIKH